MRCFRGEVRSRLLRTHLFGAFLTLLPLSRAETLFMVVAWLLTGYSFVMCIGHIIFQAVLASQSNYGRAWLPDGATSTIILQYVGFQRYVDSAALEFNVCEPKEGTTSPY